MKRVLALLAIALSAAANAQSAGPAANSSGHIPGLRADGKSRASAYKVSSVAQEYQVLKALRVQLKSQVLVINKKPYDLLTVVDPASGSEREIWFDISSFYPEI